MRRNLFIMLLALMFVVLAVPAAAAAPVAYASTQMVLLDGEKVELQAYALWDEKGNPTNYVKLRGVAYLLRDTAARFEVGWDGGVVVTTGKSYTPNGSELTTPFTGDRSYTVPGGTTKVNDLDCELDAIVLTDDSGGGYTYYKLRDLGSVIGFLVDWTAETGIIIDTDAESAFYTSYTRERPEQTLPQGQDVPYTAESFQGKWFSYDTYPSSYWEFRGNEFYHESCTWFSTEVGGPNNMEQNKRVVLSHRVTVNTGTFEIIDGYQHLTILQKESYIFYDEPRDSIYPDERDYKLEDYTDDPWIWSPRIIDWMTENTYGTSGGLSFFRLEEYPHDVQAYPKLWGFGDPYADWLAKFD